MLKQLYISGFRGFKELTAEFDPVVALMGPNSSGKTTVLHAVRIACEALQLALHTEVTAQTQDKGGEKWIRLTDDTIIADHAQLLPVADWRELFVDGAPSTSQKFEIRLSFEDADPIQEVGVEVTCASNEQLKLWVGIRSKAASEEIMGLSRKSKLINSRLTAYARLHAPRAVFIPPFYGAVREEEYRTRAIVDRLLGAGDQSHVVRNLVSRLTRQQFEELNAFLSETLGVTLTYRTEGDAVEDEYPMKLRFRDTNGELEVSSAGAGLINLIALYASLSRWERESANRSVLFLLDEPEAHLHPQLQADSTERLAALVTRQFSAQLVLATHSIDIINRVGALGGRLLRVDRTDLPSVVAIEGHSALYEELARWADLTPFTALNFLASRRVVFCEGDGDLQVLGLAGRLRYRNNPRDAQRFAQWSVVRLQGTGNKGVAGLLARLLRSDAVEARATNEAFRAITVLDRDHGRTPGFLDEEPQGPVRELRFTWSRHSIESLFVEPRTLAVWIRALVGEAAPAELESLLAEAIRLADLDPELLDNAQDQLFLALKKDGLPDEVDKQGRPLRGEQLEVRALRRARDMVRADPATWQRGKDRARFVLGKIREHIATPQRNQFPTSLIHLLAATPQSRVGDIHAAIPPEIDTLLSRMVDQSG
ncbi:MAG: AAA family ATPase [Alphaproteobacteria bacterium]|nr:AAA family ATPase [Alphaproteobacteria bacterium]